MDTGTEVTGYYDPMLAKVIARGATRGLAIANLAAALRQSRIDGIETNLAYLRVDTGTSGVRRRRADHRDAAGLMLRQPRASRCWQPAR